MRVFKRFMAVLFVLGCVGGSGYGVLMVKRYADARSLEHVIVEPAPPQPKTPEAPRPIDPRLDGRTARADGARLLWAPTEGVRLLAAGFIDNGTLIVSATATQGKDTRWRILRVDVASNTPAPAPSGAGPATLFDATTPRRASSDHPAHRNADRLCYASQAPRSPFDIWCSDMNGKNEKQLTSHDGKENLIEPAISPDGVWVAFEVQPDRTRRTTAEGRADGGTIWKIGLSGDGIQQLTRGGDDSAPSWSDDGRKIYFQRRMADPPSPGGSGGASGNLDVYAMDADGKNPGPLLRTYDQDELGPALRASTDDVIVAEGAKGGATRIKRIDAITKAGEYLTSGGFGPETSPSVSPDGALVSFLAPVSPDRPDILGIWAVALEP